MKVKRTLVIAGLLLGFGSLSSCNDNNKKTANEKDKNEVVEVGAEIDEELSAMETNNLMLKIEGDPDLGTFALSLNGKDVLEYFGETMGPYTVFAPSNAAYSKMTTEDRDEYLSTENNAFVNYLVVQALMPLDTLKEQIKKNNGQYALVSMQGEDLTFTLKDGKIQIIGTSGETAMVTGTKEASNGVIYVIDEVLLPIDPSTNAAAEEASNI